MKNRSFLPVFFSIVMILCVLFIVWYLPSVSERRFQLEDIRKSLETSQGRERKQQYEYDETVSAIPEAESELEQLIPLTEAAENEVKELKKERKNLRNEKTELESSSSSGNEEVTDHE